VAPPTEAYFRGRVSALPDSIVVLAVPEHGPARGVITDASGVWLLAGKSGHSAPGLENRKLDLEKELAGKPFECGTVGLDLDVADLMPAEEGGRLDAAAHAVNVTHTARVAVETDYEYYTKFGNVDAVNQYMAEG
jgi:hypothetical protein